MMSSPDAQQIHSLQLATGERLVAVATKGNVQIDQHFGHADDFKIYAVGSNGVRYIETRVVEHYCQGGYGDEDTWAIILRALADCSALFVARIGDGPRAKLTAAGIRPIDDYPFEAIEEAIAAWHQQVATA
ncbi:NifB/NifX family molybdenum-iron cluster-binding protein [Thiorhodococcus fuscus]|uniref:NifB/NifX family molybdenum-iron cluster-binding protein n=1 Tax=Thiorhodococcus fuscus TaxID=527200 RepID=A0ABW4YDT3_9GAMM